MSSNGDSAGTPQAGGGNTPPPSSRERTPHHSRGGNYGRFSHGGHGRGREGRGRNTSTQSSKRFKGVTQEIEDYIFTLSDGCASAKQYMDNIKQLKIYAFRHCTTNLGALFWKNPTTPTFTKPTALTKAQKKD